MTDLSPFQTMRGADVLKLAAETLETLASDIRASSNAGIAAGYFKEWPPQVKVKFAIVKAAAKHVRGMIAVGKQFSAVKDPTYPQKKQIEQVAEFVGHFRSELIDDLVRFPDHEEDIEDDLGVEHVAAAK